MPPKFLPLEPQEQPGWWVHPLCMHALRCCPYPAVPGWWAPWGYDLGGTPTSVLPTDWGGQGALQHRERVPRQGQAAVLEHCAGPRAPATRRSRDAAQGLRVLRVSGRRSRSTHSTDTPWAPARGTAPTPSPPPRHSPELWLPGWPSHPTPPHPHPQDLLGPHQLIHGRAEKRGNC